MSKTRLQGMLRLYATVHFTAEKKGMSYTSSDWPHVFQNFFLSLYSISIQRWIDAFVWHYYTFVFVVTVLFFLRHFTLVLWKTAFGSRALVLPGLFLLVLIQQMSSHLLNPHFRRHWNKNKPLKCTHEESNDIQQETCILFSVSTLFWLGFRN